MPDIVLRGITIKFPYEAYECQKVYMAKVIDSLLDNKNAILESPTGTGKTLCLLCATLAWQDHMKIKVIQTNKNSDFESVHIRNSLQNSMWSKKGPKSDSTIFEKVKNVYPQIIYTSRTHSQLSQCIKALKGCSYGINRQIGMIASRDQLCINQAIMNLETSSARIYGCRKSVQTRSCQFYTQFDKNRESVINETPIVDIEDLIVAGKTKSFCPYFLTRETFVSADIAFMPYNYILDSNVRRMFNIDLSNSVIIFDEAHNIEQVCEDSTSVDLSSIDVAMSIGELTTFANFLYRITELGVGDEESNKDLPDLERVLMLKEKLLKLESIIDNIDLTNNKDGLTKTVPFLLEILKEAGFIDREKQAFLDVLDQSINVIGMSYDQSVHVIGMKGLTSVFKFMRTVFCDDGGYEAEYEDRLQKCYRVYVQEKEIGRPGTGGSVWGVKMKAATTSKKYRLLSFWCLTPGRAMRELLNLNVRNIILTSGTLYPIDSIKTDLNINFGVELRNNHIIKNEQMLVSVCTKGPDGESLNSSFESREKLSYQNSLGNTLVALTSIVPRGLLVVFPSYGMLKKCVEKWESCDINRRMVQNKEVVLEPRDKVAFGVAMQKFYTTNIASGKGAVLLAVARGKVSEGLDLSDNCGRGVVIVGLPYPAFYEPRIKLKMTFLDERFVQEKIGLSGRAWYNLQAYRAVNQSLGRVIRHHRDFGAVFLCDERFASPMSKHQLPHWVQPMINVHNNFGDVVKATNDFFRTIPLKYPPTEVLVEEDRRSTPQVPSRQVASSQRILFTPKLPVLSSSNVQSFCSSLKTPAVENIYDLYFEEDYKMTPAVTDADTDMSLKAILRRAENSLSSKDTNIMKRPMEPLIETVVTNVVKKPRKKYRLVESKGETVDYSQHTIKAKRALNLSIPELKSYKTAVDLYFSDNNVDSLFSSLQSIFGGRDHPGLVRDFYDHLRPEHKPRYKELCLTLLGLDCGMDKENIITTIVKPVNVLACVSCHASPAIIPLGAPCKHICCQTCWMDIIDGENPTRMCPKCKVVVRKKSLVKLVCSKKNS